MEYGLCTPVTVTRIIDGDTIEVQICRRFHVRLCDISKQEENKLIFDCAEKNTKEGLDAKKFLEETILHTEVDLFVPSHGNSKLTDISTFQRILGEIFISGKKLTDILIEKGFGNFR